MAGDWVTNQLYLCEEASIKIPQLWGLESLQVGEYIHVAGGGTLQLHADRSSCA